MADNPRRAWLQQLLSTLDTHVNAMRPVLDKPAQDFGSGKAWVGTDAASKFQSEISGRKTDVHTLTDGLRDVIAAALRAEPAKIPADQARQMQQDHLHGF
jgi:hypothetical protein